MIHDTGRGTRSVVVTVNRGADSIRLTERLRTMPGQPRQWILSLHASDDMIEGDSVTVRSFLSDQDWHNLHAAMIELEEAPTFEEVEAHLVRPGHFVLDQACGEYLVHTTGVVSARSVSLWGRDEAGLEHKVEVARDALVKVRLPRVRDEEERP